MGSASVAASGTNDTMVAAATIASVLASPAALPGTDPGGVSAGPSHSWLPLFLPVSLYDLIRPQWVLKVSGETNVRLRHLEKWRRASARTNASDLREKRATEEHTCNPAGGNVKLPPLRLNKKIVQIFSDTRKALGSV